MSNEKLGAEQGRNDMERYGGSAVLRLCGKCSTPYPDYSMSSHIICWNCRNADHAREGALRAALKDIRLTPSMPFPDPNAHSWPVYGEALYRAYSRIQQIAQAALADGKEGQ